MDEKLFQVNGSLVGLYNHCTSNQPNWTPPLLSQGPLQRLAW